MIWITLAAMTAVNLGLPALPRPPAPDATRPETPELLDTFGRVRLTADGFAQPIRPMSSIGG